MVEGDLLDPEDDDHLEEDHGEDLVVEEEEDKEDLLDLAKAVVVLPVEMDGLLEDLEVVKAGLLATVKAGHLGRCVHGINLETTAFSARNL